MQVLTLFTSILLLFMQRLRLPQHCTGPWAPALCVWLQPVRHKRCRNVVPPPSPICPAPLLLLLPFSPQRFFPKPFKPQRHQTCFIKKIKIKKKQASRTCRNESWVCEAGHSIPSLFSCLFLSFCRGICQTLSVNISLHYRKSILLSPSDLSELL